MPEKCINNSRRWLILAAVILASGCTPLTVSRNSEKPIPVQLRVDDAAYWLDEWYRVIRLPNDQYKAALAAREANFASKPGPRSRLRLALLLAEGKPSGLDRARALKLVKGLEPDAADSTKALALLLENRLASLQKVKKSKASGKTSKESEKTSKESGKADTSKDLQAAQARIKELEQQLHDLTAIEQNIQERAKQ